METDILKRILEMPGNVKGNTELLNSPRKSFLCSRQTPNWAKDKIVEWANTFEGGTVVMGADTSDERTVIDIFLRRLAPVIIVCRNMPATVNTEMQNALDTGKLLMLAFAAGKADHNNMQLRNCAIINLGEELIVGYCTIGGTLSHQIFSATVPVTYVCAPGERPPEPITVWRADRPGLSVVVQEETDKSRKVFVGNRNHYIIVSPEQAEWLADELTKALETERQTK